MLISALSAWREVYGPLQKMDSAPGIYIPTCRGRASAASKIVDLDGAGTIPLQRLKLLLAAVLWIQVNRAALAKYPEHGCA